MRADDMRGLSDDEVLSRIAELERERFNLRFKSGTQTLEDPLRLRVVRKDLARLKTIQRERALGVVRAAAATPAKTTKKAPARTGRRSGR
jgi:large subunit ribosomal protein L29